MIASVKVIPFLVGVALTINFLLFWTIPIMGMGLLWKYCLKDYIIPFYNIFDKNETIRKFAKSYIYSRPEHSDYFVTSVLSLLNSAIMLSVVFYWQLNYGYLPAWMIFSYYCAWVGIGGRNMGAAYSFAHKEGHNKGMYKRWLKQSIGNIFENWVGVFYGNVPWNFSTSHTVIHHKMNAGCGDTFYMWDIDRTSFFDFMLFLHRIFMYMSGFSSLHFFNTHGLKDKAEPLRRGILTYYMTAFVLLMITRSFSFVFWIYFQPLICMSYFLAFVNIGFHGFLEFDEHGKSIPSVNSSAIVDGEDDYFGEDDHMAHHYASSVFYKDLPAYRDTKLTEFKTVKASVFQGISSLELSLFIIAGMWTKLAEHYVDHTHSMTKQEIIQMLQIRAKRKELEYEDYATYMKHPTSEMRKFLQSKIEKKFGGLGIIEKDEMDLFIDHKNKVRISHNATINSNEKED